MIPSHSTLVTILLAICWGSVGLVWILGAFVSGSPSSGSQERASGMPIWLSRRTWEKACGSNPRSTRRVMRGLLRAGS